MYVGRTTSVVNPKGSRAAPRRKPSGNPAWMLTLGPMNPKRRSNVPKAKRKGKKKSAYRATSVSRAQNHKGKTKSMSITPGRLMALMGKKKSKGHRRRGAGNPIAKSITLARPASIGKAAAGILVGVGLNKAAVSMLPDGIKGNNLYAFLASVGIALGEWWLLSMVDGEFGAAAGLGGIAEAGSIGLNNWLPAIGSHVSLGEFVPGKTLFPYNPIREGAGPYKPSGERRFAYPGAYQVSAA